MHQFHGHRPQTNRLDPAVFGKIFDTVNPAMKNVVARAVNDYRKYASDFKRLAHNPPETREDMEILRKAADFAHACVQVAIFANAEQVYEELRRAGTLDQIAVPLRG